MIIGTGIDIVDIRRIAQIHKKHSAHFLRKILTPAEICQRSAQSDFYIAGRFAAKEAASKALGTGLCAGISLQELEIVNAPSGQPGLYLFGAAKARAVELGVKHIHLSISHERSFAVALVILEA